MEGRPNTPTEIKDLRGTSRPDRALANQMTPKALKTLPNAPDRIKNDAMATEIWYDTTAELEALQMISSVDLQLLSAYCREVSRYWRAQVNIENEGDVITAHNGYPMPNPWVGVANQALDRALKIAGQFGFTPAARTRIGTPGKKESDPFDDFLGK